MHYLHSKPVLTLLFLSILSLNCLSAQSLEDFCGTTPYPVSSTDLILKRHKDIENFTKNSRKTDVWIPVQFHIGGNDDSTGYYTIDNLMTLICNWNKRYEPVGFKFYLYDMPIYFNKTLYYDHTQQEGYNMIQNYNINNVMNVYLVGNPKGVCGYAYYPGAGPRQGAVVLKNSCALSSSTTIDHEAGHYFNLPHTFSGWEGLDTNAAFPPNTEYVNGSNCQFTGDNFCDTRADFISDRWYCPYSWNFRDPNGDLYNPDEGLYMSYSTDNCQKYFSLSQINAMNYSLQYDRNYLISPPAPDTVTPIPPELTYPAKADPIPAYPVTFHWRKSEGAMFYILTHQKGTGAFKRTFVTTDTFFTSTFIFKYQYYKWRWKVQAISQTNTCTDLAESTFVTDTNLVAPVSENYFEPLDENPPILVYSNKKIKIINFQKNLPLSMELYNLQGQRVVFINANSSNEFIFDVRNIKSGLYFVKLSCKGKIIMISKISMF